jgi:uncharacterized protein (TIGR00661 family)
MKILYAVQGTGNGHVSRAREIIPLLSKRCETDVLICGDQANLSLPFEPKFRMHGLTFVHGKKGGIDFSKTYKKANVKRFMEEINDLPVKDYDFVLNDFEPVSAWACYKKKVPCIALSHQSALLDSDIPKPDHKDSVGSFILKNYAPSDYYFGLHFSRYSKQIFTPVIRKEIREAAKVNKGHYTVYLPAYDDNYLLEYLGRITDVKFHIFSPYIREPYHEDNLEMMPVDSQSFTQSIVSCEGILCGAGFETPAEALYLGKKLMVIPMKNQYEQYYNAASLKSMGVPVIKKLTKSKFERICEWIVSDYKIEVTYPDLTEKIINRIFEMYVDGNFEGLKPSRKFKMLPSKKLL